MTDTTKLFQLAQLAEAAYANFIDPTTGLIHDSDIDLINALKDKKLSQTQAEEFVKNWQVVNHQPNTTSGYSGTLFKYIGNDPNSGFSSGEHVFSLRGTETGWPWVEHVTYIIRSTGIKRNIF